MTTQPTPRQVMVVQQILRWLAVWRAGSSPPKAVASEAIA